MKQDSFFVEGTDTYPLVDSFENAFSPAFKYASRFGRAEFLLLEEYYFRANSNQAAVVVFDFQRDSLCFVIMVVAGGREGLLQLDWGAECSMLAKIREFLHSAERMGLKVSNALDH
jgi:hypothetical protein